MRSSSLCVKPRTPDNSQDRRVRSSVRFSQLTERFARIPGADLVRLLRGKTRYTTSSTIAASILIILSASAVTEIPKCRFGLPRGAMPNLLAFRAWSSERFHYQFVNFLRPRYTVLAKACLGVTMVTWCDHLLEDAPLVYTRSGRRLYNPGQAAYPAEIRHFVQALEVFDGQPALGMIVGSHGDLPQGRRVRPDHCPQGRRVRPGHCPRWRDRAGLTLAGAP
jgi:hypothetical protein